MIESLRISSKSLKGFPMGDPSERAVAVYLPPQYDANRSEPYPVAFFLAGWPSRSSKLLNDDTPFSFPLQSRFDRAIASGKLPAFIGVFPDATSRFGLSQYINSPAFGNYQDYIADEIVELIDSRFHTHKSAEFRAILGHSSGGFGALHMAMDRPDRFKLIGSAAADSYFEISLMPSLSTACAELQKSKSIEAFLKDFFEASETGGASSKKMEAMMVLSLAPCYAPNLNKPPLFGDLFFEISNGKVIPEVWARYLKWDPLRKLESSLDAIKQIKFIHLDAGIFDEYGLQWGHRQLAEKLKQHSIPHQLDEFQGGHGNNSWRFEERIRIILSQAR